MNDEQPNKKTLKQVIAEVDVFTLYVNGKEMGEYKSFGIMIKPDKTGEIRVGHGPNLKAIPVFIMPKESIPKKRRIH